MKIFSNYIGLLKIDDYKFDIFQRIIKKDFEEEIKYFSS